jgi:hypothetical protein
MAHAYTPGLLVTERLEFIKQRILPLKGDVLVKVGDKVAPNVVVARTNLPGRVEPLNVANLLGVPPEDVPLCMLKGVGDSVAQGEVVGLSKSFFGMFKSEAKAKIEGTLESISQVTGQVLLRGHPIPVEVQAYVQGEIVEIFENEGVGIKTLATYIQGIFGIGGETHGKILMVSKGPSDILDENDISADHKGCVIVGGSRVTADALKKAISVGVAAVVVGGFDDKDLRDFLGKDLGVAITGSEDLGVTLVVTEGFGQIDMAQRTFDLLTKSEGREASVNGATQIRAGVIRPEVVIPLAEGEVGHKQVSADERLGLDVGSPIRVIRDPYFGSLGTVTGLPPELHTLESESKARVLEVEFADGERATIPRANVEALEE